MITNQREFHIDRDQDLDVAISRIKPAQRVPYFFSLDSTSQKPFFQAMLFCRRSGLAGHVYGYETSK